MEFNTDTLDSFIIDKMSHARIPGLSLAILKDNEVFYSRGYGFKNISKALPADEKTLYGIGSVTKSFTALSIMMLVEEGKISLDDLIVKYVNNLPKSFREKEITVHHLLTHSSGIPALAYAEAYIRGLLGLGDSWLPLSQLEDIIGFMDDVDDWFISEPGERFFYLNEAYALLGILISKVSGMKYVDFVRENILKPLNMRRSFFSYDDVAKDVNWATPYVIDSEKKIVESRFPYGVTSDGGLISNVIDLMNYIRMYLNYGEFDNNRIVDWKYIENMEKPYIKLPYEIFGGESYGYGLMINPNFHGYKLIEHSGSLLVHTAYIGYIREKNIGIAILANSSGYRLSYIGYYILTYLLGKDPEKLYFIRNDRILEELEGEYETYKGTMKARVYKDDCILYLVIPNGEMKEKIPLIPADISKEDVLIFNAYTSWRKYNVEFILDKDRVNLLFERYDFRKKR